ncbi:acetylornithine deacetylase [Roseivirga misakiensis]|uniref:Acetylornithine deacetylase n=2 Tax=Roseivirga misakiensis TaxID=1563681 RepID=A0A1E5T3K7_9BACT|nr:M20 family metallo-hydrolase [Roseivirga misakiensis]OEK05969.1 acetylornithine deacetylase [Roseivirga misakiensis]
MDALTIEAVDLLKALIKTPSFSKEEDQTADIISDFLSKKAVAVDRVGNNIWAKNLNFDPNKPTILLNSHHDTVKPNSGYTNDPFDAKIEDEKLYGLGSNDAGGCLVSLIATFLNYYAKPNLAYNLILAASAEEEISGKGGIENLVPHLPAIDFAIVGEPTQMNLAIAEKGLMVLDCVAKGKSGHAARNEGKNAIYKAIEDIDWFKTHEFEEISETLGPIKMSVTVIEAGKQHNVVPDECKFVVDVRTTDILSNLETLKIIEENVSSTVKPRSTRLNPSGIPKNHPIVKAGLELGKQTYGSPTLSDQALMPFPSLKLGPGDSARSHTADEYIYLSEIENGIKDYIKILDKLL